MPQSYTCVGDWGRARKRTAVHALESNRCWTGHAAVDTRASAGELWARAAGC